jgi:Outer membrane lipoprotein-sorting protein
MVALAAAILPLAALAEQPAGLDQIISKMEQARLSSKNTVPFQVTREYRMYHGDEAKPTSEVKAEINVMPTNARDYRILESKGNDRGEKVVRKILDHESEAEKDPTPPSAIIRENYDFQLLGEENFQGARCYVLKLQPKRKDPALVEGRAWVDSNSFLVRKVEGEMSKSPSWWVKDVKLTVLFGELNGIWTQTATDAIANLHVLGKYTVSGRSTNLQPAMSVGANYRQKKIPIRARHTGLPATVIYNGGVLVAR